MTPEQEHKAVVRGIYERGYSAADEVVLLASYTEDFRHHGKTADDPAVAGPAGQVASMRRFREAIPDVSFVVHDVVAEADLVAARLVIAGTPVARFGPVQPTGGAQEIHAMVLFRFRDGRVAEEWFYTEPPGTVQAH